ncbi:MAG TPA: zinc-ribbon domain containing protein [Candidatus Limnocylindria bacterium]|nr:zinc-ribbon domain containing protein [Candidatus Limnocylindria bacterium]
MTLTSANLSEGRSLVFTDRTISCLDCGAEFQFTAGEQDFYAQRGFTEPPKRCTTCRAARKAARSQSSYAMAGSSGYGGGTSSGYGEYSDAAAYANEYRERRPRELFEAVCADCGRTANVPFRPSGVKPVYCSDCFQTRR